MTLLHTGGLTMTYGDGINITKARYHSGELLRFDPYLSPERFEKVSPFKHRQDLAIQLNALRKAGLGKRQLRVSFSVAHRGRAVTL